MSPVRKWGVGPYAVAVIHGGPGAPGEMAPVARELSTVKGILEPFQTETTLEGQVRELRSVITEHGMQPLTLVGFSWGAYLSWIVAARYPALIKKLILVGCPPFDEQYAAQITKTRLDRLTPETRKETQVLLTMIETPAAEDRPEDKNALFARLGDLLAHADSYAPQMAEEKSFCCQYDVFKGVWDDACDLRRKKALLHMAREITCPVIAIHGDYDPHPADGVKIPLEQELKNFRFISLKKCGHRPWIERNAAEEFYHILAQEI
ncbi:alpha/beta hydrolase [Methanoregula sp.]|uniref:alpha/beta fold hydrolase n=1 Tax=Methanoregula sp. TaxID=2052170 RepID=UPI002B9C03E0|nr:alpha/beta hydrolase [Methanoregula sp.]HVP96333.1 alpha/beta hydrolase [Methanoregula sp.]